MCTVLLVLAVISAPAASRAQVPGTWDFVVRLDGREVGRHRFVLERDGIEELNLFSQARFDVKMLGVTVYSYRHQSRERWSNGCLAAIDAKTEDGGKRTEVHGRQTKTGFKLEGTSETLRGCLMTFAYWHPSLAHQTRLLDPGSGRVESVQVERVPGTQTWRIAVLPNPIDVQWDGDRWVGLDSVVDGRRLTYRLQ